MECYFFKSSVASRLQCLFYNCLLNYDSLFPDGALPSTCTQSLLVQSYSTSCSSSSPSPLRAIEEILRRRFPPPPQLQQFSNDVICGLNLSLLRTRGNHCGVLCCANSLSAAAGYWASPCCRQHSHNAFSAGLEKVHRQPQITQVACQSSTTKPSSLLLGFNGHKEKCSCHWSQRPTDVHTDLLESKGKDEVSGFTFQQTQKVF